MGCRLRCLILALAIVLLYFLFLPQGPDMICQLRNSLLSRHMTVGRPQFSGVHGGWTRCPSPTGRSHMGQVKHLPPFCTRHAFSRRVTSWCSQSPLYLFCWHQTGLASHPSGMAKNFFSRVVTGEFSNYPHQHPSLLWFLHFSCNVWKQVKFLMRTYPIWLHMHIYTHTYI